MASVSARPLRSTLVNVPPITDLHDDDGKFSVFHAGNDSVIAYAVFPEFTQLRSFEGFSDRHWIFEAGHPLSQESEYPLGGLRVELAKIRLRQAR